MLDSILLGAIAGFIAALISLFLIFSFIVPGGGGYKGLNFGRGSSRAPKDDPLGQIVWAVMFGPAAVALWLYTPYWFFKNKSPEASIAYMLVLGGFLLYTFTPKDKRE